MSMDFTQPRTLEELLSSAGVRPIEVVGRGGVQIAGITDFAQQATRHSMFIARRGTSVDGHDLISDAVERGASVVVVDRHLEWMPGITYVHVEDTNRVVGPLCHAFHGNPGAQMLCAGVTGTNGKTSITYLLESMMNAAGMKSGVIGTVGHRWNDTLIEARNTTPSAHDIARMMARMLAEGVQGLCMEVSSHSIDQERVRGIPFKVCALSNVTRDHLDYHKTIDHYVATKRRLFTDLVPSVSGAKSVLNADDPVGEELLAHLDPKSTIGYTTNGADGAQIRASQIVPDVRSTRFLLTIDGESAPAQSDLVGEFNVQNALAAAGMAHVLGLDLPTIVEGIKRMRAVPGRFERVDVGQDFAVIIDFAHTPAAVENLLRLARRVGKGRLITVLGAGGNRDALKRPLMGAAAAELSDYVIVTNDNPRNEDPEDIARQILEGVFAKGIRSNRVQKVLDRREAIETALQIADPGDVVVIAGRGHERFQTVGALQIPFDDREVTTELLRRMQSRTPDPYANTRSAFNFTAPLAVTTTASATTTTTSASTSLPGGIA